MAVTQRFIVPIDPVQKSIKPIYPWEEDYFKLFYNTLYQHAVETGYTGTLEGFKDSIGIFLSNTLIAEYQGEYSVTPLPNMEQILRTSAKVLTDDIVVKEIPYYQTSNDAGGYTITIG